MPEKKPTEPHQAGDHDQHAEPGDGHGDHDHIHMPPNSWAPISLAFGLTCLMVGFIVGPVMWILGAVWSLASTAVWVKGARDEFNELPD